MPKLYKLPKPLYEMNLSLVSKILNMAWPQNYFRTIDDLDECKKFYNMCYQLAVDEIDKRLTKLNGNNLILDGFRQLNLWTIAKHSSLKVYGIEIPTGYSASGRYGWRFVIERSLENVIAKSQIDKEIPSDNDLNDLFTLFTVANNCAELSNYMHFLPNFITSISVDFNISAILSSFKFNDKDQKINFNKVREYIKFSPDNPRYVGFKPTAENPLIIEQLDNLLERFFKCSIAMIDEFAKCIHDIANDIHALILVQPLGDFVDMIVGKSTLNYDNVSGIIRLMFLNMGHTHYKPRNFLSRSQMYRLLNYSGLIVSLADNFESIYDAKSAKKKFVTESLHHVIVSGLIIDDWKNAFVLRLLFGQRGDLKLESEELKKAVSDLENLYHKKVFEQETLRLFRERKIQAIGNIKRIEKSDLPCGEIDGIAYSKIKQTLFILEMKNLVPSTDARSMGQVVSDHFKNKKYHNKFIRKIDFVKKNVSTIKSFLLTRGMNIGEIKDIKTYFITNTGNVVKFMVSDYEVIRYDELDEILSNGY